MKKIIIVLTTLIVAGCAPQYQYQWSYTPFSKNPKMSLEQAQAICNGVSQNAANSVQKPIISSSNSKSYSCDTREYYGTYSTNCQEHSQYSYSDSFAEISANRQYQKQRRDAVNNAYKSCMASNGWNATLQVTSPSMVATSDQHPTLKGSKTAYEGCLASRKNKTVKCRYEGRVVKQPICDCRVNGGQVVK